MFRLYLTRLILPLLGVALMVAAPFLWLPRYEPPAPPPAATARAGKAARPGGGASPPLPAPPPGRRTSPFQRAMTLGFLAILVSVTIGGLLLYGITRRQTASWARRFAPPRKKRARERREAKPPERGPSG